MTAVETIADEIAESILPECAPGTIPSHALLLREFANAYELFDIEPSDSHQHQRIADRVRRIDPRSLISVWRAGNGAPAS